ncbi:MAG: MmcQ/YjbR family DNA-binding protein [Alistipes sp.]|jgi:predicted DNA-binding protein (MmcQ/YjbR family)|nr:MmcQ/YjbR family DNA-binding protein [Alistipes sp.]
MDVLEFRDYCLSLPATTECTPFDEDTLVFKVMGKMFAYAGMGNFRWFNVKCDPARAIELREVYPEVLPGYHASKVHWNTVRTDGDLTEAFLREQIRNSYNLVVAKLPRALKAELVNLQNISAFD